MAGRVLMLHTGGTIGMVDTCEGGVPAAGVLAPYLDEVMASSHGELPEVTLRELDPLLDSSNATPETWGAIARMLYGERDEYAGFVVLHGTDTMAYTAGVRIAVNDSLVRRPDCAPAMVACELGRVAAVRLFPGFSASILRNVCRPPLQGLVIEAYGAGNGPSADREFLDAIEEATSAGVVVVIVTQCLRGRVHPGAYVTGSALMRAGAVPGSDMTTEAALSKLAVLLGQNSDRETVARLMQVDLAGELTAG